MKNVLKWLLLLGVLAFGPGLWFLLKQSPYDRAVRDRALATCRLAEHLAQRYAGRRVLVISNPFARQRGGAILEQEDSGLRGLRKGFADRVTLAAVVVPELTPQAQADPNSVELPPGATTPLSYLIQADAFDRLAAQHPDCELLVSLIGLPAQVGQTEIWRKPGPPRFALLLPDLRVLGDVSAVRAAVKADKLVAFVVRRPDPFKLARAPSADAAFDQKFLLVTGENIDLLPDNVLGVGK
jgi:hypothetical protein